MKKLLLTCLTGAMLCSAQAQLFSPESFGGALWGAVIGGIAGGDCHNGFSGDGAAIGAGIGLVAGSLVGEARRREQYYAQPQTVVSEPAAVAGYGYSPYVYTAPNSYMAPGYYYRPTRPNYAVGGTLLGAASGALIGAGDHNAGKGAAIGAGAGLLLGSVAEITERNREKKMAAQRTSVTPTTQPAQASAQTDYQLESQPVRSASRSPRQVESAKHNQITSKPVASSTYHWTSRPQVQIADAPRVPDAPKFDRQHFATDEHR